MRCLILSSCSAADSQGDNSFESASEYLQEQFESKNRNPDKQIYVRTFSLPARAIAHLTYAQTHITCATDTGNIAAVFNAVKDIVIRTSLKDAGLV